MYPRSVRAIQVSAPGYSEWVRAVDDELISLCELAVRVACRRMTPRHLKALSDSVEQICCLPAGFA
jgi:hypothetical protein